MKILYAIGAIIILLVIWSASIKPIPASALSPCGDDPTGRYKAACQAEIANENYRRHAEAMGDFSKSLER